MQLQAGSHVPCKYDSLLTSSTLKCIIIETPADSSVVKSNGLGPVLAAIMHSGRLFNIVMHAQNRIVSRKLNLFESQ